MSHRYSGITFEIRSSDGVHGSVTVAAPVRFYRRWAMWIAYRLWTWAVR